MLSSGALTDVTLSASGTSVKAHKLVLASCSPYFAQLFKEVGSENNTLVVVLACDATELNLLLTFMYTGEVTASKRSLPSLLRLAHTLKVSGLTDADTNSTISSTDCDLSNDRQINHPINFELNKNDTKTDSASFFNENNDGNTKTNMDDILQIPSDAAKELDYTANVTNEFVFRKETDRLSKLDQIVQNLYSSHNLDNPTDVGHVTSPILNDLGEPAASQDGRPRAGSVCGVCHKRLSNRYNLRVHMDTHAGRRHACRACSHVSRSRDALRKHVAYRHARSDNGNDL